MRRLSDGYLRDYATLSPVDATFLGISGHDAEMTDYSPDGYTARAALARSAPGAVRAAEPSSTDEVVAAAVFAERAGLESELHDAGLDMAALNVIASPVQDIRAVFDLMPTGTAQDWEAIARRLSGGPDALHGLRASLRAARSSGQTAAVRQVGRVADQCDTWAGGDSGRSFFDTLADGVDGTDGVTAALRGELHSAAAAAAAGYADTARSPHHAPRPRCRS